jgi:hypothetical protein
LVPSQVFLALDTAKRKESKLPAHESFRPNLKAGQAGRGEQVRVQGGKAHRRARPGAATGGLKREQKEQGAIPFHLGCFTRGLITHNYGRIAVANLPLPFLWF